ncbi:MAG: radical SAM protein [Chloroflexales bacterium]
MSQPIVFLVNPSATPYLFRALPLEDVRLGSAVAAMRTVLPALRFIDADLEGLNVATVIAVIRDSAPTVVVIQLMYRNLSEGLALAQALRSLPQPPLIVAFGHAATLSAQALLAHEQALDVIITGEPEEALTDLARAWQHQEPWQTLPGLVLRSQAGGSVYTSPRPTFMGLDQRPLPARDYLPISLQRSPVAEVRTSYGCYAHCTFCNVPVLNSGSRESRWRGHSPDHIINELAALWEHYGVRHVEFVDDNFIGPGKQGHERAAAIARGILARGLTLTFRIYCRADDIEPTLFTLLKAAGLTTVHFGIESASQRLLSRFDKHINLHQLQEALALLRQLAIRAMPSFIMFEPTMTLAELRQNLAFLSEHNLPHLVSPTGVIPFQGTPLTAMLTTEALLDPERSVVPGYIPAIRFADERVGWLNTWWMHWQAAVDAHFGTMLTTLTRSFYANLEQQAQNEGGAGLVKMFQVLKWHERDLVMEHITALEQGLSGSDLPTTEILAVADDQVLNNIAHSISAALQLHPNLTRAFQEAPVF